MWSSESGFIDLFGHLRVHRISKINTRPTDSNDSIRLIVVIILLMYVFNLVGTALVE